MIKTFFFCLRAIPQISQCRPGTKKIYIFIFAIPHTKDHHSCHTLCILYDRNDVYIPQYVPTWHTQCSRSWVTWDWASSDTSDSRPFPLPLRPPPSLLVDRRPRCFHLLWNRKEKIWLVMHKKKRMHFVQI